MNIVLKRVLKNLLTKYVKEILCGICFTSFLPSCMKLSFIRMNALFEQRQPVPMIYLCHQISFLGSQMFVTLSHNNETFFSQNSICQCKSPGLFVRRFSSLRPNNHRSSGSNALISAIRSCDLALAVGNSPYRSLIEFSILQFFG